MPRLVAAFLVAIGLSLAGWFVGHGFVEGRKPSRLVTVKGLAERAVEADLAVWTLRIAAAGPELPALEREVARQSAATLAFVRDRGFGPEELQQTRIELHDKLLNAYQHADQLRPTRYTLTQVLTLESRKVELVEALARDLGGLVGEGVVLGSDYGGPRYVFTGLNAIKPALIAEATQAARRAGDQFAEDSGSRLGTIQHANQGVIRILPRPGRDPGEEPWSREKRVRVVSTVSFSLED